MLARPRIQSEIEQTAILATFRKSPVRLQHFANQQILVPWQY